MELTFPEPITYFILILTFIIDIIGFWVVFKGVVLGFYHFVRCNFLVMYEHRHVKKTDCYTLDGMRLEIGRHIMLGLEFFVAADIVKTLFAPTWDAIGKLGAIILIRTLLSVFLTRELHQISRKR